MLVSLFCFSSGECMSRRGLTCSLRRLSRVAPAHPDVHLIIAGTDDGALSPFRDRLAELGLTRKMTYLGHVSGERARQAWAAADAFVLPSYSEGFSMAVLEAMACRLPCLITTTCHFTEAAAAGAAIVTSTNAASVTEGLCELLEMTAGQRSRLGANARSLVEAHYHGTARQHGWLLSTTGLLVAGQLRSSVIQ